MNRPKVVNLVLEDFGGDAEPIEKYIVDLEQERDQLKALLNEHLIEWEKDSGEWDEFNWIDRVSVAIDSRLRQKAQENTNGTYLTKH